MQVLQAAIDQDVVTHTGTHRHTRTQVTDGTENGWITSALCRQLLFEEQRRGALLLGDIRRFLVYESWIEFDFMILMEPIFAVVVMYV